MNVELPVTGCNILGNNGILYNYSNSGRTRTTFVIYEGKLFKSSENTSSYSYDYNGTCLHTGDLVLIHNLKSILLILLYSLPSFFLPFPFI